MRPLRSRASLLAVAGVLALGLAACGGDSPAEESVDVPAGDADVVLDGTDALKFQPTEAEAQAGEVTIQLDAGPSVLHNVVIEGVDGDDPIVEAAAGETATGTVELEPGTYTYYCSIPGHRVAGMEGTLTIEGAGDDGPAEGE